MNSREIDLPKYGMTFVDSSVVWVDYSKSDPEKGLAELERLSEFNDVFNERGHVSTADLVLLEFRHNLLHYSRWSNRINNNNVNFYIAKKGEREYSRIVTTLVNGIKISPSATNYLFANEVSEFVDGLKGKLFHEGELLNDLSGADSQLVVNAVAAGDCNGIISGDRGMMEAYRLTVDEVRWNGCFIFNTIKSELEYLE